MSDTSDQGTSPRSGRGLQGMVGADRRVGLRLSMDPSLVLAGRIPPPEVMRQLPTDAAVYIAMTCLGHEGPSYRMGKTLAHNRRQIEQVWAKATL